MGAEGHEQRPCSQRQAWHNPSMGCMVPSLLRGFPRQQLALGSGATRLSDTACPCVCQHLPIAFGTLLGWVGPSPWVPALVGARGIPQGEVLVLRDICCSDVCSQRGVEVPLPGLVTRFAARGVQPANCQMLREISGDEQGRVCDPSCRSCCAQCTPGRCAAPAASEDARMARGVLPWAARRLPRWGWRAAALCSSQGLLSFLLSGCEQSPAHFCPFSSTFLPIFSPCHR